MMLKKFTAIAIIAILATSLAACNTAVSSDNSSSQTVTSSQSSQASSSGTTAENAAKTDSDQDTVITNANVTSTGKIDATDLFSKRDLTQTADLSNAETITLSDSQNVSITKEGVYVISGSAKEVTITVDAADDAKVQLVLDSISVTNTDSPVIYVKNADKVFVTTQGDNSFSVTGSFTADGSTNTDAVIFSKDDLVLNGTGTLTISSTDNGISCKDDIKITGGTINIDCTSDAIEANDSINIAAGTINITSKKDGLHAEDSDDNTKGSIYICGGTLTINASDDAIHAETVAQIDDGTFDLTAAEGIEATYIQINGGTVNISSSDDGINAAHKSNANAYEFAVEITGGSITIKMGAGDTDGIDSNGNLYISGGTIDVTGQSPFDYDGQATHTGGTLIVNGTETNEITNQMMGGGMRGGQGGMPGGNRGNMQEMPQMR